MIIIKIDDDLVIVSQNKQASVFQINPYWNQFASPNL